MQSCFSADFLAGVIFGRVGRDLSGFRTFVVGAAASPSDSSLRRLPGRFLGIGADLCGMGVRFMRLPSQQSFPTGPPWLRIRWRRILIASRPCLATGLADVCVPMPAILAFRARGWVADW